MVSRSTEGRDLSVATVTLCRDVLAGRPPAPLPESAADRAQVLLVLEVHRLLGLWRSLTQSGAETGGPSSRRPGGRAVDEANSGDLDSAATLITLQALRGGLILEAADRARAALHAADFDTVIFKGAGLVRAGVYPDFRSRATGDADLLVRGGEPAAAVAALERAGFAPWVPWEPGRDTWLPACALTDTLAPAELEVTIDLHWRIPYGSFRSGEGEPDQRALWEGAELDRGLLSHEVHTLLLAEHFVRHLRVVPHLVGIADIVRILPHVTDPVRLRSLAARRGSLRLLQGVLAFVRHEVGVGLDPGLLDAIGIPRRRRTSHPLGLSLEELLASGGQRLQGRVRGLVSQASLQWDTPDMVRELIRVVYPPTDWLARRAGSGGRGAIRDRLGYWRDLVRWVAGRGVSPLSPNQEFEGPTGRQ